VPTNRPGGEAGGRHRFLGGEEALASMTAAPGLRVGLYAGEAQFPALANPVQMSFDTRGRLWVAVWPSYPHLLPGVPPHDKLLVLEDTDGDGRADSCTAFADDLHNPTGFEFWNGGVLVAQAPDLLYLKDLDRDGRADVRERVLHGLSSSDTHHTANSFVLGPDGALYFQEGIFHHSQIETPHGVVRNRDGCVWRYEPRTGRVERWAPYGFLNPHGHVFDRWGQDFVTDGTGNENYWALPLSGAVLHPDKHEGYFTFLGQRSRPAAATEILSSAHFPDAMQGDYLIANVIGFQGIFRYRLLDDGAGFAAEEAEPILHSADPNFRPVDLEVGPDGALYVADWHNPLIGHMQHHLRDPSRDHEHGRIYRVSVPGRAPSSRVPIAGRPVAELVELLGHREDRVRYRARIELSGRGRDAVVRAARAWAASLLGAVAADAGSEREHRLLEALWLQQQHGVLDEVLLERLLTSPDPRARAAAVRVLRHMRRDVQRPHERVARAVADEHPRVRAEAVVALSFFPNAYAAELTLAARRPGSDRFLDYAVGETMDALRPAWSAALAAGAPFAADDPDGLAWTLARLDTDTLRAAPPGAALDRELLSRPGLDVADTLRAAEGLAGLAGTSAGAELLAAIGLDESSLLSSLR
jgi:glucose/arabinose dehydrogenase